MLHGHVEWHNRQAEEAGRATDAVVRYECDGCSHAAFGTVFRIMARMHVSAEELHAHRAVIDFFFPVRCLLPRALSHAAPACMRHPANDRDARCSACCGGAEFQDGERAGRPCQRGQPTDGRRLRHHRRPAGRASRAQRPPCYGGEGRRCGSRGRCGRPRVRPDRRDSGRLFGPTQR
eukprot:scaffold49602_cov63-Phaeocystis_antarctica.AAC.5